MRSRIVRSGLGAALTLAVSLPLQAQDWRDMTSSRQIDGESSIDVLVRYGVGEFRGSCSKLHR